MGQILSFKQVILNLRDHLLLKNFKSYPDDSLRRLKHIDKIVKM